ncbi:hypothetical protein HDU82_007226 [Entophlyctis luteolus]|nr:hypothetical protein HDU82_007226 [Entophlyctis luteolus]
MIPPHFLNTYGSDQRRDDTKRRTRQLFAIYCIFFLRSPMSAQKNANQDIRIYPLAPTESTELGINEAYVTQPKVSKDAFKYTAPSIKKVRFGQQEESPSSLVISQNASDCTGTGSYSPDRATLEYLSSKIGQEVTNENKIYNLYHRICEERQELPIAAVNKQIQNQVEVVTLDLANTLINVRNVKSFSELLRLNLGLQKLDLLQCGLSDDAVGYVLSSLAASNSVAWLSLRGNNKVGLSGMKSIAVFIKKANCLEYIDLSEIAIDTESARLLGEAVKENITLREIKLEASKLRSPQLAALAPGISQSCVQRISLRNNRMPFDCVSSLSVFLSLCEAESKMLTSLDLSGNLLQHNLGGLTTSLATNKTLQDLDLSDNKLDESNLIDLYHMMQKNATLVSLNVSNNFGRKDGMSEIALAALSKLIQFSKYLRELCLSNVGLKAASVSHLVNVLKKSKSLRKLDLSHNFLEVSSVEILLSYVQTNNQIISLKVLPLLDENGSPYSSEKVESLNEAIINCCKDKEIHRPAPPSKPKSTTSTKSNLQSADKVAMPIECFQKMEAKHHFNFLKFHKELLDVEWKCQVLEEMISHLNEVMTPSSDGAREKNVLVDGNLIEKIYDEIVNFKEYMISVIFDQDMDDHIITETILRLGERITSIQRTYKHQVIDQFLGTKVEQTPRFVKTETNEDASSNAISDEEKLKRILEDIQLTESKCKILLDMMLNLERVTNQNQSTADSTGSILLDGDLMQELLREVRLSKGRLESAVTNNWIREHSDLSRALELNDVINQLLLRYEDFESRHAQKCPEKSENKVWELGKTLKRMSMNFFPIIGKTQLTTRQKDVIQEAQIAKIHEVESDYIEETDTHDFSPNIPAAQILVVKKSKTFSNRNQKHQLELGTQLQNSMSTSSLTEVIDNEPIKSASDERYEMQDSKFTIEDSEVFQLHDVCL